MLIGQQLGPFLVEKELGSGAMGTVYRGIYTKTKQRVAIKVMAPGLIGNEQSRARFTREANILKQFNHPNIVRLFATGKHQGLLYYAMEYIEGESLDHVLARRGRLSWEEICTFGQQLCSALQHSHDRGVIHRDLKPSNLMILPDGTLKLTDFGIAKDLDVTQLTEANCTVGTASYMSPEQCRGERNLTNKSDIYSMGIVFYELLTGRKPFICETVMDMFMAHVQGTFERPSRLVLDVPKWLDTLICQMMEKKPEQRPLSAAVIAASLSQVMEKVEALQSAGVDAARKRTIDRAPGDAPPDQKDREAAQTLLGKKRKKKKPRDPFYTRLWFQIVGIVVLVSAMGGILYAIFAPPSLSGLYHQAERLMASQDPEDWNRARSGPISAYLNRTGLPENDETRKMREWANRVDMREKENLLSRMVRNKNVKPQNDMEATALEAVRAEEVGDLGSAAHNWREVKEKYQNEGGARPWMALAERRLVELDQVPQRVALLRKWVHDTQELGYPPPEIQAPLQKQAFLAMRYERFGDLFAAEHAWAQMKTETEKNLDERLWFLVASSRARDVEGRRPKEGKDARKDQIAYVQAELTRAEQLQQSDSFAARKLLLEIASLYETNTDTELQQLGKKAREMLQKKNS